MEKPSIFRQHNNMPLDYGDMSILPRRNCRIVPRPISPTDASKNQITDPAIIFFFSRLELAHIYQIIETYKANSGSWPMSYGARDGYMQRQPQLRNAQDDIFGDRAQYNTPEIKMPVKNVKM